MLGSGVQEWSSCDWMRRGEQRDDVENRTVGSQEAKRVRELGVMGSLSEQEKRDEEMNGGDGRSQGLYWTSGSRESMSQTEFWDFGCQVG